MRVRDYTDLQVKRLVRKGPPPRRAGTRFMEKVRFPNDSSGCWEWNGHHYPNGYASFIVGSRSTNRGSVPAHRVAWILTRGSIPEDAFVLHRCDNRGCVNPQHLFLGTHSDNMQDMLAKGRGRWQGPSAGQATAKDPISGRFIAA